MVFFPYYLVSLADPSPTSNHYIAVHVHESFFLFAQSLHPQSPPLAVILFSIYGSVHIFQIIWYLSFPDWLVLLNIIFASFIHTVTKGKIFFFFVTE